MSTGAENRIVPPPRLSAKRKRRHAAAAFITLLILAVFWPSPVVSANRLWLGMDLPVDELSFLGRQAHSWDVVFWFFAGLLLLAIVQSAEPGADVREPLRQLRALRFERRLFVRGALGVAGGIALTAAVWLMADQALIAWVQGVRSESIQNVIRLLNRLGGGMNPVMVVVFFLVAGVAYLERRWVSYAIAMAISGLAAGLIAQLIKHLVGRARPELWLGAFHYAPGSSTSFPSGHTVGAFALAGILIFGARSPLLRITAFLIAAGVGAARIFAFRHWPSDVTASAILGLTVAWIVTRAVVRDSGTTSREIVSEAPPHVDAN
jgi:membrane-associated phospholipid phosphatase